MEVSLGGSRGWGGGTLFDDLSADCVMASLRISEMERGTCSGSEEGSYFKAHQRFYLSTPDLRVLEQKEKDELRWRMGGGFTETEDV